MSVLLPNGESFTGLALDSVLLELCEAKRTALLATPYLAFETRFLHREGQELHLWATMSKSVADHALAEQSLRIRFPWALGMWAGPTRILGFEQDTKRRFLRVAIPDLLRPDEQRKHWRTDRCGRSSGTLGTDTLKIVRITPENLSQSGVGVFSSEPLDLETFGPAHGAVLNLQLEGGVKLQSKVRGVQGNAFRMGFTFDPPLSDYDLGLLTDWLKPRWAEANRAWRNRAEVRAELEESARAIDPEGLLLVGSSPELELQLRPLLEGLPELRVAPPVISGLKKALQAPPNLAILDLPQGGLEERRRYRALLEALSGFPVILLASPRAEALAEELEAEFKAYSLVWNPSLGIFLKGMVIRLLKKHSGSEKP